MVLLNRHNFFRILLFIAITVGVLTSLYGYYQFFNYDPWLLADKESLEKRLYADEASLIGSALSLPDDAHILVSHQYWMANYYLYPRKLFYIAPQYVDNFRISELIKKRKIEWIFLEERKGFIKLAGMEE